MVKLSQRLKAIADQIPKDCIAADVGTDHAWIPIYLLQEKRVLRVILTDSKEGPLLKAKENLLSAGLTVASNDIRRGDGLSVLAPGEASVLIVAGMGGLLIAKILGDDPAKSHSFHRLILQPRTASAELRRWLLDNEFVITEERLAPEGRRLCEIITAEPRQGCVRQDAFWSPLDYELPPLLFEKKDPWLKKFIQEKLREAGQIRLHLEDARDPDAPLRILETESRMEQLKEREAML